MPELDAYSHELGGIKARVGILEQDMVQVKSYLPKIDKIDTTLSQLMDDRKGEREDRQHELEEHKKTRQSMQGWLMTILSGLILLAMQQLADGTLVPARYHVYVYACVAVVICILAAVLWSSHSRRTT